MPWLRPLLPLHPWRPLSASAADEAAFDQHLDEMAAFYGRGAALTLNLLHLLFWPTDRLLLPADPRVHEVMNWFRATTFANHTLFLVAVSAPGLRRYPRQLLSLAALVSAALFGSAMASLGGLSQPYFYMTLLAPLGISAVPARLPQRLLLSPICGAVVCLAYFVTRPEELSSPRLGSALALMLSTVLISLMVGQGIFQLIRRAFLSERALARSQQALKGYSEHLEDRIEDYGQQVRRLAAHLARAAEEERARLARELHDETAQQVTALRFLLQAARNHGDDAQREALLGQMEEALLHLTSGVRELVANLRPRILDERGLIAAVRWLVERTAARAALQVSLALPPEETVVPAEPAIAVFRIVQEALTNALRHARPRAITVSVELDEAAIRARVTDDGCGMRSVDMNHAGMGIFGMSERARALGGHLTVESQPGEGTTVCLELPRALA